jgi:hypothetical protein
VQLRGCYHTNALDLSIRSVWQGKNEAENMTLLINLGCVRERSPFYLNGQRKYWTGKEVNKFGYGYITLW